jgi:enoyl-CoA hydratase/carnithine racemase
MTNDYVLVDKIDRVGYVTLDRPQQRNPLSAAMMTAVTESIRELSKEPDVAVIVVKANGPAFSAGHNLHELVDRTLEDEREIFRICTEMMQTIQQVPQPVIAAVQGTAVAAGCQLVATCDLAVASTNAVFGTPGVKIGLFCSTPMVAVSRAIGRKRALQMLLTGTVIDAQTAADWGLINEVVAADQLDARVTALASSIAAASSSTLAIGKEAFYRRIDLPQDAAYDAMQEVMATNAVTCDAQEGMSAFIAKREPVWEGR